MKKKIVSYNSYQKLRAKWQKEIGSNSKVHRLYNKVYTLADKNNYYCLYSWNEEPLPQKSKIVDI